jgi:signal transduction histidine kinase/CheY-like chemotaxis protein/ligand-binding sensor domain-containing protein
MRKNLICFFLLLLPLWAWGQTRNDEVGRPFITVYGSKEYGGHFQNWAFAQDQRGIMYVGNGSGLLEFDGVSWRLIDVANKSFIRSLAIDENGRIYDGSDGDFGYFAPDASGRLQNVSLLGYINEEDRDFGYVWTTQITPEGIYFQSRERLFRFTPQPVMASEAKQSLGSEEKSGGLLRRPALGGTPRNDEEETWHVKVWKPQGLFNFAFWRNGVYYVHQGGVGLMKMVDDSLRLLPGGEQFADDRLQVMLPFTNGAEKSDAAKMLVGTFNRGLFLYDGHSFQPFKTEANAFLRDNTLYDGTILADGSFGLVTLDGGLVILDRDGNAKQYLNQIYGLPANNILSIFADRQGTVWLGVSNGICLVEYPSPLSRHDAASGIIGTVYSISRHKGILYTATDNGVFYLDAATSTFKLVSGLAAGNRQSWKLLTLGDNLLAVVGTGIYQIAGTRATIIRENIGGVSFVPNYLHRSLQDSNRVFVALFDGLASLRRFPSGGGWIDEGRIAGIHEYIRNIVEVSPGILWLSTSSKGTIRVRFSDATLKNPKIERFGREHGLPSDGGVSVFAAAGRPVFAMKEGVFRFDENRRRFLPDSILSIVSFGGVQDEYSLAEDDQGNIWFNFGRETAVLRRQADGSYLPDKTPLLRFADVPSTAIYPEKNGVVWFGSTEGVIRYDPRMTKDYAADYPALIRRVVAGEDSVIYGGAELSPHFNSEQPGTRSTLSALRSTLSYANNALRFEFAAASFDNPTENQFQTMLEGFSDHWSNWSKENKRDYTNLPPGNYRFRVKAKNIYQHESREAVYEFKILPPWYRTWWAYGGYVMLLGLLVLTAHRVQHRRLVKRERQRAELLSRIGKDITASLDSDTIFYKLYENVNQLIDATIFGVGIYHPEQQQIEYRLAIEKGKKYEPYMRDSRDKNQFPVWCIENRQPVFINDVSREYSRYISEYKEIHTKLEDGTVSQDPQSLIYLPLIAKDNVLGIITVQSFQKNAYSGYHLHVLQNLAAYTTIAIDNANAYRQLNAILANLEKTVEERTAEIQKQKENVELLSEIGKEITASLDMDTIFFKLYEHVNQLADASIFGVGIYHPEKKQIEYRLAIEKGKRYTPYTRDTSNKNQFPVWCIENRQPVFINDVEREYSKYISEYNPTGRLRKLEDGSISQDPLSLIYLPLIAHDQVLGVISIQSFQKNAYTDYHLSILQNLAAYTTVALDNARLFAEAQQARAAAEEANEAKSSFLSTVSHELRTPLTSVLGFAKIIKKRLDEKIFPLLKIEDSKTQRTVDQVAENLNVVVAEGERLTTLINNVLDLAKIEAGKIEWQKETLTVPELIERATAATSSLFDSSGLKCLKEIEADLPEVIGDRDKLIQVVINLISNAVKFTDKGSVTCHARRANGEIIVSVIDTGSGIAPEDQPKVFEKFKQVGETLTNKPKGTGLGLTICKEIVEHHGGRIWVESEIGKGSTFSFALPSKTKAARDGELAQMDLAALLSQLKQRVESTAMKLKNGKPTILVVDDEASIRELLNQNLHDAGYDVRVAANGREALEQIRREHPDLVILDVMMPEMNGFDVAAVLKNDPQTMDIPILILSIVQDRERGFRLGIDRYLTKPIDTEALFREVGALLEQGKSHRKVMVVDEDASTVKTLAEVLQARGYHVVEANGTELIKKAVSEKPDIIILNSLLSEKQEVVKSLRFEKGLEDVLFLVYQ